MMKTILSVLLLAFLAGCAVFEQTPEDVQRKLTTESTKGRLYERDPLEGR
jgi:hypothetical protein